MWRRLPTTGMVLYPELPEVLQSGEADELPCRGGLRPSNPRNARKIQIFFQCAPTFVPPQVLGCRCHARIHLPNPRTLPAFHSRKNADNMTKPSFSLPIRTSGLLA
jgi:hypothetical protein